jgi:hypothetical protein
VNYKKTVDAGQDLDVNTIVDPHGILFVVIQGNGTSRCGVVKNVLTGTS